MRNKQQSGFTIVEVLIIIVVIVILATVIIVAYRGINENAQVRALEANLSQASKTLDMYGLNNTTIYPTSLETSGIKVPDNTTYTYTSNGRYYCLAGTYQGLTYRVTSTNAIPAAGSCVGILADGSTCPTNYVLIPGNTSFGTSEFCVMKYEAKNVSGVATSQAAGTPWVNITQTTAITTAAAACTGCRLMTDAEWMTIAANVLSVPTNWSGNAVGSGYIYSGHSDSSPNNAIAASTDDSDGYNGTGNASGQTATTNAMQGNSQRRTLTLTTGEVIWDLAGNVWEWTSSTIGAGQQPGLSGDASFSWKQWNNPSMLWNGLPATSRPSAISVAAGNYSSAQGIGQLYSNRADSSLRGMMRGANWSSNANTGVLSLILHTAPGAGANSNNGFRVVKQ